MKKVSDSSPTCNKISRQRAISPFNNQHSIAVSEAELTNGSALGVAVITKLHLEFFGYTMQRLKANLNDVLGGLKASFGQLKKALCLTSTSVPKACPSSCHVVVPGFRCRFSSL